jgi:hypothetical protein
MRGLLTITLEARRVKSFRGELIFYDLGKETITIKPRCAAAKRFVADVSWGRLFNQTDRDPQAH